MSKRFCPVSPHQFMRQQTRPSSSSAKQQQQSTTTGALNWFSTQLSSVTSSQLDIIFPSNAIVSQTSSYAIKLFSSYYLIDFRFHSCLVAHTHTVWYRHTSHDFSVKSNVRELYALGTVAAAAGDSFAGTHAWARWVRLTWRDNRELPCDRDRRSWDYNLILYINSHSWKETQQRQQAENSNSTDKEV